MSELWQLSAFEITGQAQGPPKGETIRVLKRCFSPEELPQAAGTWAESYGLWMKIEIFISIELVINRL